MWIRQLGFDWEGHGTRYTQTCLWAESGLCTSQEELQGGDGVRIPEARDPEGSNGLWKQLRRFRKAELRRTCNRANEERALEKPYRVRTSLPVF